MCCNNSHFYHISRLEIHNIERYPSIYFFIPQKNEMPAICTYCESKITNNSCSVCGIEEPREIMRKLLEHPEVKFILSWCWDTWILERMYPSISENLCNILLFTVEEVHRSGKKSLYSVSVDPVYWNRSNTDKHHPVIVVQYTTPSTPDNPAMIVKKINKTDYSQVKNFEIPSIIPEKKFFFSECTCGCGEGEFLFPGKNKNIFPEVSLLFYQEEI